jgi:hypothetical protein
MARVATIKIADKHVPQNDVGAHCVSIDYAIANGEAANGDRLTLLTFPRAGVLHGASIAVAGSLGAAATIQLQHSDAADATHTSLTGATTAAGADRDVDCPARHDRELQPGSRGPQPRELT